MKMHKNTIFSGTGSRLRVGFLDEVRGICIILMVAYHAAYDVIYIFGWDIPLFHSALLRYAQPFVAGIFIFISGIACRFSRGNVKRGIIILALGLLLSAFTLNYFPAQAIYFGILHLLGVSMILFAFLRPVLDAISSALGALLSAGLFVFTYGAASGYLGIPGLPALPLPGALAETPWLLPFGFFEAGADYFPLLPWFFLFITGSYIGNPFVRREMPEFFYRTRSRTLALIGRRTIYIYVLHQPVLLGILYGVSKVMELIMRI